MAYVITFCNQKGGVGKTTTVVNTAAYLASLGKKILVVDVDPQANATSGFGMQRENIKSGLYECLSGSVHPKEAVMKTETENCFILPSSSDLAGAAVELISVSQREFRLFELLRLISDEYDFVLIDCPPSLGILTINGLVAAQKVVIPVQCEYYALEGLSQLLRTIHLVKEHISPHIDILGAVLTMHDKRNKLSQEVAEEVRKNFPGYVFQAVIPRSVSLAEAPSFGKPIMNYKWWSQGAQAYNNLAREILDVMQQ